MTHHTPSGKNSSQILSSENQCHDAPVYVCNKGVSMSAICINSNVVGLMVYTRCSVSDITQRICLRQIYSKRRQVVYSSMYDVQATSQERAVSIINNTTTTYTKYACNVGTHWVYVSHIVNNTLKLCRAYAGCYIVFMPVEVLRCGSTPDVSLFKVQSGSPWLRGPT
jgi:hypothetical protein